jgi:hypothetical protein
MSKGSRRCARRGCRAWAMRGQPLCRAHRRSPGQSQRTAQTPTGGLYEPFFTAPEWEQIRQELQSPQCSLDREVSLMRIMIRRVMERIGQDDPAKALPLVRQAMDAICRALRTERVLSGEASDSLAAALGLALNEIGEELGLPSG